MAGTNPGLKVLESEERYEELGKGRYLSGKVVHVRARHHGISVWLDKFYWTGGDNLTPGDVWPRASRLEFYDDLRSEMMTARVTLPIGLRRNQEETIGYTMTLLDERGHAKPYFSWIPGDLVHNHTTLRVRFNERVPERVLKMIFLSREAGVAAWEELKEIQPGSNEVLWEIEKPRPHFKYEIAWGAALDGRERAWGVPNDGSIA